MPKKCLVKLTPEEREQLIQLTTTGKADAAQEGGVWPDKAIVRALEVGCSTVERVCERFALGGLHAAVYPRPHPKRPPTKTDGKVDAPSVIIMNHRLKSKHRKEFP